MPNALRAAVRAVSGQIFSYPCVEGSKLIRLESNSDQRPGLPRSFRTSVIRSCGGH